MQLIESQCFHALVEHLERRAPELVPACQWLACGPRTASLILGKDVHQPTSAEIASLEAQLVAAPAAAVVALRVLLAAHYGRVATINGALKRLFGADDDEWSHPTEILGRPCPVFGELLAACRARLEFAPRGARPHLLSVAEKLERAVRIAATARRRREARA